MPSHLVTRALRFAVLSSFIAATALAAHHLPNLDAVANAPVVMQPQNGVASLAQSAASAVPMQWHDRFGVPSFVWLGAPTGSATSSVKSVEGAARAYLFDNARTYGLDFSDAATATVAQIHDTGRGAIIVRFQQRIDGIEVFRETLNVAMTRSRQLVAASGFLAPARLAPVAHGAAVQSVNSIPFALPPEAALAAALHDLAPEAGAIDAGTLSATQTDGGYTRFETTKPLDGGAILRPARVKRVWFHLPDHLEAAYHVTLDLANGGDTDSDVYSYVISAADGRVLFRNDLVADAGQTFSYRVWADTSGDHRPYNGPQGYAGAPHPTGKNDGYQAPFTVPNLISLANGPISTGDPWLPQNATQTTGNNVDAYADLIAPDGFTPGVDMRADTTSTSTFDYAYDVFSQPDASTAQRMATITQLFYTVNFLHDWYYDSGFNEAAGNAQDDNYGRGGIGGDPLRAEAQDYSGRNNANMSTPADGESPRMQMYIFNGRPNRGITVDSPQAVAGSYAVGTATFGLQQFNVTGSVVTASPNDGCAPIAGVSGKIAFIDRGGNCGFAVKAVNAQKAGAIGVIIGNVATSPSPSNVINLGCSVAPCPPNEQNTMATLQLTLDDANAFRRQLATGSVHATLKRDAAVDRDGGLDNFIVAHEWTHYLSNRLIGNGDGLNANESRGMGEGWSDFGAMLMIVRAEDAAVPSNTSFNGAYAGGSYAVSGGGNGPAVNGAYYFGVRRVPYSTDMTLDPLTYGDITQGVAINGNLAFGANGSNNQEVHNTGEVWASMLWECYAALLRDTLGASPRLTFAQAQARMKDYLVASLKLTPVDPTFLEARNAVLAVAYANDPADFAAFWQAFAKRGAGVFASAGDRYSFVNSGGKEDFSLAKTVAIQQSSIDDSVTRCNADGILESGETGLLHLTIRNSGTGSLEATTARITSSDSRLTFENGGNVAIPSTNPNDTVSVTVKATLARTTEIVIPTITMKVSDAAMAGADVTATFQPRLNAHDEPKVSASETFEGARNAWTPAAYPIGGTAQSIATWQVRTEGDHDRAMFAATRTDAPNDTALVSPPLIVSQTEPFAFTFRHRHSFDEATNQVGLAFELDGGVLEISTDDGQTWTDIGAAASPGYTASIATTNENPLEGRKAFTGDSAGFRAEAPLSSPFSSVTVNLGLRYAGQRVRVRFRFATGRLHTDFQFAGWEIDDIQFSGITNLPFYGLVADTGVCGVTDSVTTVQSPASVLQGQTFPIAANVAAALTTANGTVDFFDNGALMGTAAVIDGIATFNARIATTGAHTVTAAFNGTANARASSSSPVTLTVNPLPGGRRRAVGH